MKRTWKTLVAIALSLVAGMMVSSAMAGEKGGNNNHSNFQRSNVTRQLQVTKKPIVLQQQLGGHNFGGVVKPIKKPNLTPPVFQTPIKPFPPIVVKPPVKPFPPIVVQPFPPVKPFPPIVKPPVKPFPPIVVNPLPPFPPKPFPPKPFPPKPLPPICPVPFPPIGHCPPSGPCWPLPGHCYPTPICYPSPICDPVCLPNVVTTSVPVVQVSSTTEVATVKLPEVIVGSTIALTEASLAAAAGQVLVEVGDVTLATDVLDWTAGKATVKIPFMGIAQPKEAKLWLMNADGQVASTMAVMLIPAQPVAPQATTAASTTSLQTISQ